ncbi:tyrosine-protein phosphatase [uncultured Ilyobacter sp.]|uniref:fused DSP-PTPase phosphatase/NAD kinase-like protein n=1 Tax=uncultured Ilyobacter sp. TaxID=544433 RepID=UPI0029F568D7|nr:tyrosine-protein phosphatase [uncultured Ilyobacter sp.]
MRRKVWHILALTLVFLPAGCGTAVFDDFAPLLPVDNFAVIESERAYRSAQVDRTTLAMMIDNLELKTVINLRGANPSEQWYINEKAVCDEKGVTLVDIRWSARELPSQEELLKYYDAIKSVQEPILIHCKAGADRTGAAAAIWRMTIPGEARETARFQLNPFYGHFQAFTPYMDELVAIYQTSRDWIVNEYTGMP